MRGASVAVLAAFLLAGCSGSAGGPREETPETSFDDIDVKVTKTTGAILGLVVDDRIVPVAQARVHLTIPGSAPQTTETDAQGRFVFQGLTPGTYFLQVSHFSHVATQTTAEVVAGVEDPPLVRVQLVRLFTADPYHQEIVKEGFFECTAAAPVNAPWYASAMCVDFILGPTITDAYPESRNLTQQRREWHTDVGPGWQSIFVEMQWEPSAQGTSENLGITLSTYKPTRDKAHNFLSYGSGNPLWARLDVGVDHAASNDVEPDLLPAEGMENMSFFVGVRTSSSSPVSAALNQDFKVFLNIFYYAPVTKEDWSFVAGDVHPF